MVARSENIGGGEMVGSNSHKLQQSRRRRSFNKPSWLLCSIADLDERMKMLTRKENSRDSFGARANSYYHERPQLLELVNDLYNSYLSLADRYCQALDTKQHHHSQNSQLDEVIDCSDVESLGPLQPQANDALIADIVMKTVECDIVLNELNVVEKKWGELSRKMELQKNLLDVLESERLILLNDNVTLRYRVTVLAEENKGLASESLFLKRKAAADMARCVLKTREDHRVCMLSRKIEDLQGQIYGLEKRNKEYFYEHLVMKGQGPANVDLEHCVRAATGLGKCFSFNPKKASSKLWDVVKKFDLLHCGPSN